MSDVKEVLEKPVIIVEVIEDGQLVKVQKPKEEFINDTEHKYLSRVKKVMKDGTIKIYEYHNKKYKKPYVRKNKEDWEKKGRPRKYPNKFRAYRLQKVLCKPCNKMYSRSSLDRHVTTDKHKLNLSKLHKCLSLKL